jgi:uncharacterized protein YaiL (DUF2058 family)
LVDRANAGVQKKKINGKRMTKAQRLRQQKGMDRAEAVLDRLEIKKAKSLDRAKSIKERRVCKDSFMKSVSTCSIEHMLTNSPFLRPIGQI